MMKAMLNAMRLQAQRNAESRRETSVGMVTSYDPDNFAVRVKLQVDGTLTGWLPLASPWVGNGWGMFAAPSVGDMVAVEFFGAALEAGFVEGRLYNDEDRPLPVASGEFWLVHKSGSFLKFTKDGDVLVQAARDLTATVGRNLTATVGGDLASTVSGDASLTVDGKATLEVQADASVTVGGALTVTASGGATINAETVVNGALEVNGPTTLNGPITQGAGAGGSTEATLLGPLRVSDDISSTGGDVSDSAGSIAAMRAAYNAHKGHASTGGTTPDHPM